ncbi:MAG TPA: glycosyltransferase family 39 protein, partial [Patescibacteria group bacterium]|nr:glycosyltransferase family 39 protein [Patescibacteria group bacterium]
MCILAAICLAQVAASFYLFQRSEIIWRQDTGGVMSCSVDFYEFFRHGQYLTAVDSLVMFRFYRHPLLFSFLQGLFLFLSNKVHPISLSTAVLLTNAIFSLALLISIYAIGKILYNNKAGLYAGLLFSFSPLVFGTTRIPMLELPLAAMVTLGFLCLLKTEHFRSFPASLLAGIFFALAQMTKETAFLFIVPPLAYYTAVSAAKVETRARRCLQAILTWLLFL